MLRMPPSPPSSLTLAQRSAACKLLPQTHERVLNQPWAAAETEDQGSHQPCGGPAPWVKHVPRILTKAY